MGTKTLVLEMQFERVAVVRKLFAVIFSSDLAQISAYMAFCAVGTFA